MRTRHWIAAALALFALIALGTAVTQGRETRRVIQRSSLLTGEIVDAEDRPIPDVVYLDARQKPVQAQIRWRGAGIEYLPGDRVEVYVDPEDPQYAIVKGWRSEYALEVWLIIQGFSLLVLAVLVLRCRPIILGMFATSALAALFGAKAILKTSDWLILRQRGVRVQARITRIENQMDSRRSRGWGPRTELYVATSRAYLTYLDPKLGRTRTSIVDNSEIERLIKGTEHELLVDPESPTRVLTFEGLEIRSRLVLLWGTALLWAGATWLLGWVARRQKAKATENSAVR